MTSSKRPPAASALSREVGQWVRAEAEDRLLKGRVAAALGEIRDFIDRQRSDLERRKNRLIQTTGYKDETRGMEASLGKINALLSGGKNVSRVFAAIDAFLDTYKGDATFDKEQIREQLSDASDDFICRFHDGIRGSRLAELLDILAFMPNSDWRPRSVDRRNFRSPSAAQVAKLIEESRQRGIDVDGIETVQLAAMLRIKLGITPRMGYHLMPANKLAEKLVSEENVALFASGDAALTEGFCRAIAGIQAAIRRWSAECFGDGQPPAPPEVEAEMLQLVYLATDAIRITGAGQERSADYLWLLATVMAGDHAVLKDVLTGVIDRHSGHPSVRERMAVARAYLEGIAGSVDRILVARWSAAKEELRSLTARSEAIAAQRAHEFAEYTELEGLKEARSDVVKSLIKLAESIQLVEPSLLDRLALPGPADGRLPTDGEGRRLEPAHVRDRNYRISEETKAIALQELEKLRLLILRITEISRRGFLEAGASSPARPAGREQSASRTSDGVELTELSTADLHAKLRGALQKIAAAVREFRGRVEGVRRRYQKGEILHALGVLHEKTKKAGETCDGLDLESDDAARTMGAADAILPLLREIMAAQTNVGARINTAKLSPAERQPLTALLYAAKLRPGDEVRDLERMRAELAARPAAAGTGEDSGAGARAIGAAGVTAPAAGTAEGSPEAAASPAAAVSEDAARTAAVARIGGLIAAAGHAVKSVKALMTGLDDALQSEPADLGAVGAAAAALKSELGTAREELAAQRSQVEALAAASSLAADAYADRFERWQRPLAVLEAETERLLGALAAVAGVQEVVVAAAALEQGIMNTLRPPPGEGARDEPFIPVRRRCVHTLGALHAFLTRVRKAQDQLAAERAAGWKVLKGGSRCVDGAGAALADAERVLAETQERVAAIHGRFKDDRPGSE